jgi:hypothetical protein
MNVHWIPSITLLLLSITLAIAPKSAAAKTGGKPAFNPGRADRIQSLAIIFRQDTARFVKTDGRWLTGRDRYPADPYRMRDFLKTLLSLESIPATPKSKDPAAPSDFGFGPEEAKEVEWTDRSGKVVKVVIGKPVDPPIRELDSVMMAHSHDPEVSAKLRKLPIPEDSLYWRFAKGGGIFRSPGNLGVPAREEDWKDRNIFPFFLYTEVQSIEVDWRDSSGRNHHYKLDRKSDTAAVMAEPRKAAVPRRNAAAIFIQAPQFAVDEIVLPGDSLAAKAGLDKPIFTLRIVMKDKKRHVLQAGEAFGKFHYAKHPDYGLPVKISRWRLDNFRKTVEEILDPAAIPPDSGEEEN